VKRYKSILKSVIKFIMFIVLSLGLAVVFRVFIVAPIISIPSKSMEPAVMAGDRIIVTKLIPGARVFEDFRQFRIDGKVQTKRLRGIRQVRRNNVLVFNFPYSGDWDRIDMDLNVLYLKRCVALPGDTFSIENGIYKVNNCLDSLGCAFRQQELTLQSRDDFSPVIWNCFPHDSVHYSWNIKDFGPLYVPASGNSISLDIRNMLLYKNLIEYETNQKLSVHNGLVYLADERLNTYTFKLNYYFMAGDNIFDSGDSRYWGLLPEDCMIGKAIFVTHSKDPATGKFRWKRLIKIIK